MPKKDTSKSQPQEETKRNSSSYTLSDEDQQFMIEALQKVSQASGEYGQLRYQYLQEKKKFDAFQEQYLTEEKKHLENISLLTKDRQSRLEMIGKRMKVPQNYQLNLQTMTWEPQPE